MRKILFSIIAGVCLAIGAVEAAPEQMGPHPGVVPEPVPHKSTQLRITELAQSPTLSRVAGDLATFIRPAVVLDADEQSGKSAIGRSRIGGDPDLPDDITWPVKKHKQLSFLAQINLGGMPRALGGALPEKGMLWFFYDVGSEAFGMEPSDRGSWAVLYREDAQNLQRRDPPKGAERFSECSLGFRYELTPLDPEAIPRYPLQLTKSESESYSDLIQQYAETHDLGGSQLLGNPFPIQNDVRVEAAAAIAGVAAKPTESVNALAREWRLLFQLDSESCAKMMWGDSGMLYFMIKDDDLKNRRFDQSWMVMQCF